MKTEVLTTWETAIKYSDYLFIYLFIWMVFYIVLKDTWLIWWRPVLLLEENKPILHTVNARV